MSKFHINKNGVPAPCKAQVGNCPLGGDNTHFKTKEEAQKYADKENIKKHGLLANDEPSGIDYEITKLKNIKENLLENKEVDLSKDVYDSASQLEALFSHFKFDTKFDKLSNEELKERLKTRYRIEISDLDNMTREEKLALEGNLEFIKKKKIGNIVGFINSTKNTSYSRAKGYSREELKGSFNEVYPVISLLSNPGKHKSSAQAANTEATNLNVIMDKKSLEIALEIISKSPFNKDSEAAPAPGVIASVQALRLKGWSDTQIKNVSTEFPLHEVVYHEYDVKPRRVAGCTQLIRVFAPKLDRVEIGDKLKTELGWSE